MSFREATDLKVTKRSKKVINAEEAENEEKEDVTNVLLIDTPVTSRILKGVKTTAKGKIVISYVKRITWPLKEGEEQNKIDNVLLNGKLPFKPHKEFYSAMKKLTKHALELLEIYPDEAKGGTTEYAALGLIVKGELDDETARVNIILGKHVKRTDKNVNIQTGEVALYDKGEEGGSSYEDVDALARAVEKLSEAVFEYMDGKAAEEEIQQIASPQLPLF